MGERLHEIWERLKADIHRNPGLWIGVGISAVILVIAYLAYRKSTGLDVPANGFGFPDYGTATGGGGGDGGPVGSQPFQPPSNPFNPITPTAPVANPLLPFSLPPFAPINPVAPFSPPTHMIGTVNDQAAPTSGFYPIQNPTASQDQQHQGSALPLPPIHNPTAGQDQQHRDSLPPIQNPTATAQKQHKGSSPKPPKPPKPPTTLQPTNSGHGRAA